MAVNAIFEQVNFNGIKYINFKIKVLNVSMALCVHVRFRSLQFIIFGFSGNKSKDRAIMREEGRGRSHNSELFMCVFIST